MITYTIYDPVTGNITGSVMTSRDHGDRPENSIDGLWDSNSYRVESGVAVLLPQQTPDIATMIRAQRNQDLAVIDRVNPIWYAALTSEQQAELAAYRQALLDVPQQAGFPASVAWPQQPSWL